MKKIFLLLMMSSVAFGQIQLNSIGSIIFSQSIPNPPTVSTSVVGALGQSTYVYWVVANFPNGIKSTPSVAAPAFNAPNTLTSSNYVKISWNKVSRASSYDILKTTGYTIANGDIALATAQTATTINDTGQTLASYTIATSANPASCNAIYDVLDYNPGKLVIPCLETSGGGMTNPMTTLGDIIMGGNGGVPDRLGIGTSGQVLTVSGGVPEWADPTGGMTNPMTTAGDLILGGTSGSPTRLGIGANGDFLSSNGTTEAWNPIYNQTIQVGGSSETQTSALNLVAGSNMTITPSVSGSVLTLTLASSGGGGTATAIQYGTLANIPACTTGGQVYIASDQPVGSNLYVCDGTSLAWSNMMAVGPSGALQITNGAIDITNQVPLVGTANTFTPAQTFTKGTTTTPSTFANLTACSSTNEGTRSAVTDSTTTTFLSVITGGGTNHVPAYCNGTNWVVE